MSALLLSGMACNQQLWKPLLSHCHFSSDLHYVDLTQGESLAHMLDIIHSAVEKYQPTSLISFSMGGYLTIEYLLQQPTNLISKLVLISCSAKGYTKQEIVQRRELVELVKNNDIDWGSKQYLKIFLYHKHPEFQQHLDLLYNMTAQCGREVFIRQQTATRNRQNRELELKHISIPTLILRGTNDLLVSAHDAARLADNLPDARLLEIPNVGHMLPIEKPVEISRHINNFLQIKNLNL